MKIRRCLSSILLFFFTLPLAPQESIYVLRKGDTLYSIAKEYGISYEELMNSNKITDPRRLQVGQEIRIPLGNEKDIQATVENESHKVNRGETLFGIAAQYGITIAELRAMNGLSQNHLLKEGEVLSVPQKSKPSPSATVVETAPQEEPENSLPAVSVSTQDPRQRVSTSVNPALKWPVGAKDVAYMTGKLYGVVITGERYETVRSLSGGTVVSAMPYRGFGRVAMVQAPDSHVYVYGGCESLSVKEGDPVVPGMELGKLGIDALSEKPQLFFLVYRDNMPIDPAEAPRS